LEYLLFSVLMQSEETRPQDVSDRNSICINWFHWCWIPCGTIFCKVF